MARETADSAQLPNLTRDTFSVKISDKARSLQRALHALESFGAHHGLPRPALHHIQVALDEIITNIFSHGYRDTAGLVELAVALRDDFLELQILDEADAFNLLEQDQPDVDQGIDDRPIGGLGIFIVRSLIDEIEYSRQGDRNSLLLRKKLVG